MPKTDTPATRRSSRVAARGDTKKPEPVKAAPAKKAAAPKKAATEKKEEPAPASEEKEPKKESKKDSKEAPAAKAKPASKEKKAPASKDASAGGASGLALSAPLPKITIQDNTGADVDVSTIAGEKGVVIFLYPKAATPGCTTQACGYRDIHAEIAAEGYDVYGLSKDKPSAQQKWIDSKNLNYKLLCDPESKLIKKLGAFVPPNNTKRSHFIFEKGSGKLIDIALGVKPADDPTKVLAFIKKHHA